MDTNNDSSIIKKEAFVDVNSVLIGSCKSNWYLLNGILVFVIVTLLSIDDISLYDDRQSIQLPLLGISISSFNFFFFAPVLIAGLYVYLHTQVETLWNNVTNISNLGFFRKQDVFLLQYRAARSWLVLDWALSSNILKNNDKHASGSKWIRSMISVFFFWLFGPVVLFTLWFQSAEAHIDFLTLWAAGIFILSIYIGNHSWSVIRGKSKLFILKEYTLNVITILLIVVLIVPISLMRTGSDVWNITNSKINKLRSIENLVPQSANRAIYKDQKLATDSCTGVSFCMLTSLRAIMDVYLTDMSDFFRTRPTLRSKQLLARPLNWTDYEVEFSHYMSQRKQEEENESNLNYISNIGKAQLVNECRRNILDSTLFSSERRNKRSNYILSLEKPRFEGRNMTGLDLNEAFLANSDFSSYKLNFVNLDNSVLEGSKFRNVDLRWSNLLRVQMQDTVVSHADLSSSDLTLSSLTGSIISDSKMSGAIILNTNFQFTIIDRVDMNFANINSARFRESILTEVSFVGSKFINVDFRNSYLCGAWIKETELASSMLTHTNVYGSKFYDTNINRVDFSNANLVHVDFVNTKIENPNFFGSQIYNTTFEASEIINANFRDTYLFSVNISQSKLYGSKDNLLKLHVTNFYNTKITDSAFRYTDMRYLSIDEMRNISKNFADGSNIFSDEFVRPCHWPDKELDDDEFLGHWRGFLEARGNIEIPNFLTTVQAIAPPAGCKIDRRIRPI